MSRAIFMRDGAPAHTASRTQEWCKNNMPDFWAKGELPGNSQDSNPIENLWSILQEKLNEMKPSTNLNQFAENLKSGWRDINPLILENLVAGMPAHIDKCIQLKGGYIGK
ncbi:Transposase [Oopsacas minuta]|uniref:Transposase n=1 Tax=Oopsacas minuta TaxID=111878 RepID=A0AAV7KI09_9METZ|nr:Transposase [Oopsacas minuta]